MKQRFCNFTLFLFFIFECCKLFAHGTQYEIIYPKEVTIQAKYNSGLPMSVCQVLFYKPLQEKASFETMTDLNGLFSFIPSESGTWICKVRDQEGHGLRINLNIGKDLRLMDAQNHHHQHFSLAQKIIMSFCIIWGLVGTALFFQARKKTNAHL